MGKIGIPNGIEGGTSIGNGTLGKFEDEKTITKVVFGNNCTFVGNDAFENCTLLSEINKNNIIEEIGSNAFAGTAITSAKFNYLTKLGHNAFYGCKKLNDIELGYCSSIGESAFEECENLNTIIMPNVNEIHKSAFKKCKNLNDIELSYCSSIGESAFEECEKLQKINLYECTSIGKNAFKGCTDLKRVYIYNINDVCVLGENAFDKDNVVFYIHPKIFDKYIEGSDTDSDWDEYTKVKMVQNNQIIYTTTNGEIFNNDNFKTSNKYENGYGLIQFPAEISALDDEIFGDLENSSYLKSIDLPESCIVIGENALSGCTNLTDITTLGSLTEIRDFAFQNCESLTTFTIPQSVTTLGEGIFAGCSSIKNFNGKFVTNDGKSIVHNKKLICVLPSYDKIKLNISDINSSITTLGKKCFYGCESLRRIDIPSNITQIGDNAFEGCTNLREVHFHGDFPKIGNKIFGDIDNIKDDFKIFIPEDKLHKYFNNDNSGTLKYYSKYIYPMPTSKSLIYYSSKKISISNATIENKTNPFADYATNQDYKTYYKPLNSFTTTNISFNWFKDNADVNCVILGEKITGINNFAFQNCTKLEYIYLPNGISYLGNGCFQNCSSLKKIHIPFSNPNGIADSILIGCENLTEFGTYDKNRVSDDGRCYIYNSRLIFFAQGGLNGEKYTIPESVKEIGNYAFKGSKISEITLNNTKKIGEYAFSDSSLLTTINWGGNVETISAHAFYNCTKMKTNIPNSVNTIGKYAFYGCTGLESIDINKNIRYISECAFRGCTSLHTVNISNNSNLEQIHNEPFRDCTNLANLNLSSANNLKTIGESAFYNCTSLAEEINIPNGISFIGNSCFRKTAITKLTIYSNTLESISPNTFRDCASLQSVEITGKSSNLIEIEESAFENCQSLESVKLSPQNLKIIGKSAFKDCVKLTKANITTSSIEYISSYAFYGCKSLNSFSSFNNNVDIIGGNNDSTIQLPNSIKTIGDYAFYECNQLWKIILPENLLELGTYCFGGINNYGISSILTIIVPDNRLASNPPDFEPSTAKPFGEPATDKNYYYHFLSIYVPKQYADRYKIDKYWSKYKNNINNSSLPIDRLPKDKLQNDKLQNDYETVLPR